MSRKKQLEEVMVGLAELNRLFATTRDGFLAGYDLSRPQIEMLFAVKKKRQTIGELAEWFRITRSAVSQMATQLEENQLVVRRRDQEDRRIVYVELSDGAREYFTRLKKELLRHISLKFTDLSDSELQELHKIIAKVNKSLDKE